MRLPHAGAQDAKKSRAIRPLCLMLAVLPVLHRVLGARSSASTTNKNKSNATSMPASSCRHSAQTRNYHASHLPHIHRVDPDSLAFLSTPYTFPTHSPNVRFYVIYVYARPIKYLEHNDAMQSPVTDRVRVEKDDIDRHRRGVTMSVMEWDETRRVNRDTDPTQKSGTATLKRANERRKKEKKRTGVMTTQTAGSKMYATMPSPERERKKQIVIVPAVVAMPCSAAPDR